MTDAFTQFGLLLASVWGSGTHESGPVQREAATDVHGEKLLFAADRTGRRYILAPVPQGYAFTPLKGAAVEMDGWTHPQSGKEYLRLVCTVDALAPVFYRLADSVVQRIQESKEPCGLALQGALDDWRRLLKPAPSLSEDALRGIFGELTVLRLLARRNPIFAADAWTGPLGNVHDFETAHGQIEVKATKREGLEVEISSLYQLDSSGVPLCLVRLPIRNAVDGHSIGMVVDELVEMGCLRSVLVEKLDAVGFQVGVSEDQVKFAVAGEVLAWRVDAEFPGLRSVDIPEERRSPLTRIKYTLDLLNAPGLMTKDELGSHVDQMMTQ